MIQRRILLALLLSLLVMCQSMAQKNFSQEGKASYYADKFQGRSTASGERYDKAQFTCAHMTLPYGTNIKVTNLENKKQVVVRVNDRGPFAPERIVDVSRAAAEALDMIAKGVVKVRIAITSEIPPVPQANTEKPEKSETEVKKNDAERGIATAKPSRVLDSKPVVQPTLIEQEPTPAPTATVKETSKNDLYAVSVQQQTPAGFALQVGSFNGAGNLLVRLAELQTKLKTQLYVLTIEKEGNLAYKLLYGVYKTKDEAQKAKEALQSQIPDCFIITL